MVLLGIYSQYCYSKHANLFKKTIEKYKNKQKWSNQSITISHQRFIPVSYLNCQLKLNDRETNLNLNRWIFNWSFWTGSEWFFIPSEQFFSYIMARWWCLPCSKTNALSWNYTVLAYWINNRQENILLHSGHVLLTMSSCSLMLPA